MLYFIFGIVFGSFVLEFFIINFFYLSNVSLFNDLILTEKNRKKLRDFYERRFYDL